LSILNKNQKNSKQNKIELIKQLNALSDEKKILRDVDIERKIDKLASLIDSPDELLKVINVFISDLKLMKDRNDYSKPDFEA
jgi:uncharacterized protein with WD repeat